VTEAVEDQPHRGTEKESEGGKQESDPKITERFDVLKESLGFRFLLMLSICLSPFLCTRVLKWSVFHTFPVVGQTISALAASPDKNTLLNLLIRY